MTDCKSVRSVDKVPHANGQAYDVLVFRLKTHRPVTNKWPKPVHKIYMWQSRVENEHYSASMKIKLNALGHCLHGSRLLAPSRVRAMIYTPRNTAHFGIANHSNYCHVSKNRKARPRQGAVRVLGRLFVRYLCAH